MAVANVERVVQPQAVVAAAGPHAQEACLTVDVEVVKTTIGECLEAYRLEGARRRCAGAGHVVAGGQRRAARHVGRIGRRRRGKRRQSRGAPEEALAVAKIRLGRVRVLGEVGTKGLLHVKWRLATSNE